MTWLYLEQYNNQDLNTKGHFWMWKFQTLCIQFSLKIDQQLGNRKRKFFLMVVTINVKKNITMYKYN